MKIYHLIILATVGVSFAEETEISAYLGSRDPLQISLGLEGARYETTTAGFHLGTKLELNHETQERFHELLAPAQLTKGDKNIPVITHDRYVIVHFDEKWFLVGRMDAGEEYLDKVVCVYEFKESKPPFMTSNWTWYGVFENPLGNFFHEKSLNRNSLFLYNGELFRDLPDYLDGFEYDLRQISEMKWELIFNNTYSSQDDLELILTGIRFEVQKEKIQNLSSVSDKAEQNSKNDIQQ